LGFHTGHRCNSLKECRQTPIRNPPRKFSWPWRIPLMKECRVSHSVWRKPTSGEEGRHRRKSNRDQWCCV
jgi:hypothetical protein